MKKGGVVPQERTDYALLTLGVAFILLPLAFVVVFPEYFDVAQFYLRLVASLGGALIGAWLPGLLHISIPGIRAGGALAVLVLFFQFNPPLTLNAKINPPLTLNAKINPKSDKLLFKVLVNSEDVTFFRVGDIIRGQVKLHFKSTITDNSQSATVFIGFVNVHDAEKLDINKPHHTTVSCAETPSCLVIKELSEYTNNPIIIHGSEIGEITDTIVFDIPLKLNTHKILIHWVFFQKEADGGICDIDNSREWNSDGIPYLSVFNDSGMKVDANCHYYSENRIIVPVTLTKQ